VIFFFGGWAKRRAGARKQANRTTSLVRMSLMMHHPESKAQASESGRAAGRYFGLSAATWSASQPGAAKDAYGYAEPPDR